MGNGDDQACERRRVDGSVKHPDRGQVDDKAEGIEYVARAVDDGGMRHGGPGKWRGCASNCARTNRERDS